MIIISPNYRQNHIYRCLRQRCPKLICRILCKLQQYINWLSQMNQNNRSETFIGNDKFERYAQLREEQWRPSMPNESMINKNSMRWSSKENKIYCDFLKIHREKFNDKVTRKKTRVYYMLSKKLRKRTALQVKSHHQKMFKRFHTIENIITQLEDMLRVTENESTLQNQKTSTFSLEPETYHKKEEPLIAQPHFIMFKNQFELELGIEPHQSQNDLFDNGKWFADE